jgi:myb proto-oncogene protein
MQQNGSYELHPVDRHPFFGDYTSAAFNDLGHQFFADREMKKPIFDQIGHMPLLTPKTEVSHLMDSGLGSYKPYVMNGRFLPRKKISLKKANVVKGQWTPEEDRLKLKSIDCLFLTPIK